jgi:hypothetical protein
MGTAVRMKREGGGEKHRGEGGGDRAGRMTGEGEREE